MEANEFNDWFSETLAASATRVVSGLFLMAAGWLPLMAIAWFQREQLDQLIWTVLGWWFVLDRLIPSTPPTSPLVMAQLVAGLGIGLLWKGFFVMAWSHLIHETYNDRPCSLRHSLQVARRRYRRLVIPYVQIGSAAVALGFIAWQIALETESSTRWPPTEGPMEARFLLTLALIPLVETIRTKLTFIAVAAAVGPDQVSTLRASMDVSTGQLYPVWLATAKMLLPLSIAVMAASVPLQWLQPGGESPLDHNEHYEYAAQLVIYGLVFTPLYKAAVAVLYSELGYIAPPSTNRSDDQRGRSGG